MAAIRDQRTATQLRNTMGATHVEQLINVKLGQIARHFEHAYKMLNSMGNFFVYHEKTEVKRLLDEIRPLLPKSTIPEQHKRYKKFMELHEEFRKLSYK